MTVSLTLLFLVSSSHSFTVTTTTVTATSTAWTTKGTTIASRQDMQICRLLHSGKRNDNKKKYQTTTSNVMLYLKSLDDDNDNDNEDDIKEDEHEKKKDDTKPIQEKPMSRLAMAAADWLEEEEEDEDELSTYWNKFEEAKSSSIEKNKVQQNSSSFSKSTSISTSSTSTTLPDNDNKLSTEELLDRYYVGRGIDKSIESKYTIKIQNAIQNANKASSASEAIQILTNVRPYMQINTKVGGNALIELSLAYRANGDDEQCVEIYDLLKSNSHLDIRRQVKQIMKYPDKYQKVYGKNNWNGWNSFSFGSWWP